LQVQETFYARKKASEGEYSHTMGFRHRSGEVLAEAECTAKGTDISGENGSQSGGPPQFGCCGVTGKRIAESREKSDISKSVRNFVEDLSGERSPAVFHSDHAVQQIAKKPHLDAGCTTQQKQRTGRASGEA